MELRKIRFNQSWGIACGPICGDTSVECLFYDDECHSFFVYASILDMGLVIGISEYSIFDIMNNDGGDYQFEMEKVKRICSKIADYDACENDEIGEFFDDFGIYHKAVMATLNVLQDYLGSDDTEDIEKVWTCKKLEELDCCYHPFFVDEGDD